MAKKKLCGARRKNNMGKCKAHAMPNGRCRIHGGMSTGAPLGSQNNLKHGIYVKALSAEELEIYGKIEHGSVVDELKICRLQLRRALIAMKEYVGVTDTKAKKGFELSEIEEGHQGGFDKKVTTKKLPDFRLITDRLMSRIASLERTQLLLDGDSIDPDDKAARILRAMRAMEAATESG